MPSPCPRLRPVLESLRHALAVAETLVDSEPEAAREALLQALNRAGKKIAPRP